MEHKKDIKKYNGTIDELVEDIGDLHYLELQKFLLTLSEKIKKDSEKDFSGGRVKLSIELDILSQKLFESSSQLDNVWKICEKYM